MSDWLALATYTLVMSITPGPNNVMVMASGATFGFRRTVPHLVGISTGFTAQTLIVCSGFGAVFAKAPGLRAVLAWIGVAYMVYLAWRLLGTGRIREQGRARPVTAWEAMLFQFVNPKAWVMAVTTALVFMPKSGDLWPALLSMGVVLLLVNGPCISIWAAFGSALRVWLDNGRRRVIFNGLMAAMLLATAVVMLWT